MPARETESLGRDERDRVAGEAILREARRWGHASVTPSLAVLMAARALDAADKLAEKEN